MTETPPRKTSGSEKRQRTEAVRVRCTKGEYAALWTEAERTGMSMAALVRLKVIGTPGPRSQRRPPVKVQLVAQAIGLLGRCGGNLNQIARALNSGEAMPPGLAESIEEARAAFWLLMKATGRKGRD